MDEVKTLTNGIDRKQSTIVLAKIAGEKAQRVTCLKGEKIIGIRIWEQLLRVTIHATSGLISYPPDCAPKRQYISILLIFYSINRKIKERLKEIN